MFITANTQQGRECALVHALQNTRASGIATGLCHKSRQTGDLEVPLDVLLEAGVELVVVPREVARRTHACFHVGQEVVDDGLAAARPDVRVEAGERIEGSTIRGINNEVIPL